MYEEDEILEEEIDYGLNFTKMQLELKLRFNLLKLAIDNNKKKEVNKLLLEIDNILE